MLNRYELEVRTACPVVDGELDIYQVTITSSDIVPVENIIAFFGGYARKKIFQEELTRRAATALGVHVETVGLHSGVTVRSVAP